MALTSQQAQLVYNDINAAFSDFFVAYATGNSAAMRIANDRVNRDEWLIGATPQILYPGYTLPANYDGVPNNLGFQLPPFVPQPPAPSPGTIGTNPPATAPPAPPAPPTPPASGSVGTLLPSGPITAQPPSPGTTTPPASTTPPSTGTPTPPAPPTPPAGGSSAPKPLPMINSSLPRSLSDPFSPGGGGCAGNPFDYCCMYPEDPACGGGGFPPGFPFPFPGGFGGSTTVNNYTIVEGVTESTVWSDIWGALSGLWSVIVGAVDAAIIAAIAAIQSAITAIAQALANAFHVLARLAGLILKFLQSLLRDIVRGIARAIQEIGRRLAQLAQKVLIPVLRAIARIRQRLMDIYNRFIRPAMIILQRIRAVLGILKIFHVKWAAKLDAAIADIQRRVLGPFLQVLGYLNLLANWINLIITVGYLIQKPIWLNSLNAYKGSTIALQLDAMTPHVDAGALAAAQLAAAAPDPATTRQDLGQRLTTGAGTMNSYFRGMDTAFHEGSQQS